MKFGLPCLLAQTKQAKFFGSEATKHTSMCYNYVSCMSFPEIPRYNWNQWYRGVCVGNDGKWKDMSYTIATHMICERPGIILSFLYLAKTAM